MAGFPKIKLCVIPIGHPKASFTHELICLAEGFRELGVEFYGDDDYWREPGTGEYLIKKAPAGFRSEVDVYTVFYFRAYPERFAQVDRSKYTVFIDRDDGLFGDFSNPRYASFNLILRAHYNKHIPYGKNVRPWAFGLSNRIVHAIGQSRNEPVQQRAVINFRIAHPLRKMADTDLTPVLSKKFSIANAITKNFSADAPPSLTGTDREYWVLTGSRHDPDYYKLLNSSTLTYAFGGFIYPRPYPSSRYKKLLQKFSGLAAAISGDRYSHSFIDQFDSWRFWEAMCSNSCALHMDFEQNGWVLPIMPLNKKHYFGVEKFNFKEAGEELNAMGPEEIMNIARAGTQWAIDNYSPRTTAERFLKMIGRP